MKKAPAKARKKLKRVNKAKPVVARGARRKGGFKKHSTRVTTSSKDHVWRTPKMLLDLVEKVIGKIKLDPCASHKKPQQFARNNFTGKPGAVDGLVASWRGYGAVYANPPYGRTLRRWMKKVVAEFGTEANDDELILLVPARPDTVWFQDFVMPHANGLCFWKGRLKFSGEATGAPFPSLIVYFGKNPQKFEKVFSAYGWTMTS